MDRENWKKHRRTESRQAGVVRGGGGLNPSCEQRETDARSRGGTILLLISWRIMKQCAGSPARDREIMQLIYRDTIKTQLKLDVLQYLPPRSILILTLCKAYFIME